MEEILKQVIHGRVHLQIGKSGITKGALQQLELQFKKKNFVKLRFLSLEHFANMKDAANKIAKQSNAKIVDLRGKTVVLQGPKRKQ